MRVVALAMVAVLGGAALVYSTASVPPSAQSVTVPGLGAPVTIWRDELWVPHIFAENLTDATLALGFVHAQDRMWQMDVTRRLTAGRLAEILGARVLGSDRWMRTLGLSRLATQACERLSPETAPLLAAYSAGVNLWLQQRSETLPPEFDLLRYRPHPWSCADSILTAKALALRLARNRSDELLRWRLSERLTPQQLDDLWPETDPAPVSQTPAAAASALPRLAGGPEIERPLAASNAWVVAGERSVTGSPILANDPHLRLTQPNTWHLVRIVIPDGEMTGASVPGVPFLVAGHNGHIAWGLTSSEADIEDLVVERLTRDGNGTMTKDGPRPIVSRTEVISVKGEAAVHLQVRNTIHGPIVTDVLGEQLPGRPPDAETGDTPDGGTVLALAATYLAEDDHTAEAAFSLSRARSWPEFEGALAGFQVPPLNFLYADRTGVIGQILAGRIPIRAGRSGFGPLPGWTGDADWLGFVPSDRLPRVLKPEAGFLVNANERTVPTDFPWYVASNWEPPLRASRIAALLRQQPQASLDSSSALQLDLISPSAQRLLPLMLDGLPDEARANPLLERLHGWSGAMDSSRIEPTVFAVWLRELDRALFADELEGTYASFQAVRPTLTEIALTLHQAWCDDVTTPVVESCGQQLERSLKGTETFLKNRFGHDPEGWQWGTVHRAPLRHPLLNRIPLIHWFSGRDVGTGGGWDTINRGAYQVWDDDHPLTHVHGAGLRAVYDLSDLGRSRFVIAGGQSGNPLTRHFNDFTKVWQVGGWVTLTGGRSELERRARASLVLSPG